MGKLAGYVIVRGQEPNIEIFIGFRARFDTQLGHKLVSGWEKPEGVPRVAMYPDHLEAEGVLAYIREAEGLPRVEPLWIGDSRPKDSRGEFEEVVQMLDERKQCDLNAIFDNNADELIELLETGSVTLQLEGQAYVFTLNVAKGSEGPY